MKKILYTIVFLMTIATYSQKEGGKEWTLYSVGEKTGNSIYYQTFKKNSSWFKTVYKKPKVMDGEKIISYVALYVFDCEGEKIGKQSSGYYNEEGSVINYEQKSDYVVSISMEYPFPDTQELAFLNFFCNKD